MDSSDFLRLMAMMSAPDPSVVVSRPEPTVGPRRRGPFPNLSDRSEESEGFVLMLAFPKRFEFIQFAASLPEECLVRVTPHGPQDIFHIYWPVGPEKDPSSIYFNSLVVCIEESDVLFSYKLSQILKVDNAREVHLILCGTSGGSKALGHKMGDVFEVTQAVKFDRGSLTSATTTNTFEVMFDSNIFPRAFPSHVPLLGLSLATSLCSNYIMHFDPSEVSRRYGFNADLADMETFEFFKVCEVEKVRRYQVFRIVSDIYGNDAVSEIRKSHPDLPSTFSDQRKASRFLRKVLDMTPLVKAVHARVRLLLGTSKPRSKSEVMEAMFPPPVLMQNDEIHKYSKVESDNSRKNLFAELLSSTIVRGK